MITINEEHLYPNGTIDRTDMVETFDFDNYIEIVTNRGYKFVKDIFEDSLDLGIHPEGYLYDGAGTLRAIVSIIK